MIDWVLDALRPYVDTVVVVGAPEGGSRLEEVLAQLSCPTRLVVQPTPTGMLDAVQLGVHAITEACTRVWVAWCDQVALSAETISKLAALDSLHPDGVIFPVVVTSDPYIHFTFDDAGRIVAVQQRREGDDLPSTGVGDAGLFSLPASGLVSALEEFRAQTQPGARTGEYNFLPVLPWLAKETAVHTFEIPAEDAHGINTPADLANAETVLRSRGAR